MSARYVGLARTGVDGRRLLSAQSIERGYLAHMKPVPTTSGTALTAWLSWTRRLHVNRSHDGLNALAAIAELGRRNAAYGKTEICSAVGAAWVSRLGMGCGALRYADKASPPALGSILICI